MATSIRTTERDLFSSLTITGPFTVRVYARPAIAGAPWNRVDATVGRHFSAAGPGLAIIPFAIVRHAVRVHAVNLKEGFNFDGKGTLRLEDGTVWEWETIPATSLPSLAPARTDTRHGQTH